MRVPRVQANGEDRDLSGSGSHSSQALRLRVFAVTASLCLHFMLIFVAIRYGEFEIVPPPAPTLTIGLIPNNPLMQEQSSQLPPQPQEPQTAEGAEEVELTQEPEPEMPAELPEAAAPLDQAGPTREPQSSADDEELAESAEPETAQDPSSVITIPSVVTIQNRVAEDRERQQAASRDWRITCTELQRVSGVLGCQTREEANYRAEELQPQRQSVYEFHNPPAERSRAERSLSTIASHTGELAASLAMADLPDGLSDYLMAEVEAGISLYSNQGDPVLDNMDRMVDRSAASQMARELFNPWVQLQMQQQQQRRYYSRRDRQVMATCGSPFLLILAPGKFADCLVEEGQPGPLLPLMLDLVIER